MDQLFDGKRAYEHIRILSKEIGTRLSGTEGKKKQSSTLKTFYLPLD